MGRLTRIALVLGVKAKRDGGTHHRTQVEDGPEDTDELGFLVLERVGQHYRTLSRPQEASADTENCTSSDDEGTSRGMDVHRPITHDFVSVPFAWYKSFKLTNKIQCREHIRKCPRAK